VFAVELPGFQDHDFEICALAFSKDERLLATVGNERSVTHSATAMQCAAKQQSPQAVHLLCQPQQAAQAMKQGQAATQVKPKCC
jgi:hypothetical protein